MIHQTIQRSHNNRDSIPIMNSCTNASTNHVSDSFDSSIETRTEELTQPLHELFNPSIGMNDLRKRKLSFRQKRLMLSSLFFLIMSNRCCIRVGAQNCTYELYFNQIVSIVDSLFEFQFMTDTGSAPVWRSPIAKPVSAPSRVNVTSTPSSNTSAVDPETIVVSNFTTDTPFAAPASSEPLSSVFPSNVPSTSNTIEPTKTPTDSPTLSPSVEPTIISTSNSTIESTDVYTSIPTISPMTSSLRPKPTSSLKPTYDETMAPSRQTDSPVGDPIAKPVAGSKPTFPLTTRPSLNPQNQNVPVIMQLSNTLGKLDEKDPIDFVAATEAHIVQSIESMNISESITNLSVQAYIDSQRIVNPNNPNDTRRLQDLAPLQVSFKIIFTFQSIETNLDCAQWVKDAFSSNSNRIAYIGRLQQLNSNFNTVTRVDVKVDGKTANEEKPQNNIVNPNDGDQSQSSDTTLWIIVGASAGGFLLLLLLVVIISRRDKNGKKASAISSGNKLLADRTSVDETTKMGYAAEINVDRQDDISTLGDPVYGGHVGGMFIDEMEQRDEYTASVGPDYDYSKHFLGASGSGSMGTAALSNALHSQSGNTRDRFASEGTSSIFFKPGLVPTDSNALDDYDDVSFEEQYNPAARRGQDRFEVQVPPGKLGMVIDTPNNGVPVVHAIKQESILCDRVHVGDRLISVDGEDVTSMTAVQVSKLISLKSDQQRLLVFLRAKDMNASDSSDLMIDS